VFQWEFYGCNIGVALLKQLLSGKGMKLFFLVLARDEKHVKEKIWELKRLGVPYLIVCGKKLNYPNVVFREPMGKYDAINFGFSFIPKDVDVVALNDVDTKIHNIKSALKHFYSDEVALVFARVSVKEGPQSSFYVLLDFIRRRVPIAASGELMLIRREVLSKIIPIKPCKAEDSYILFKVLEFGHKIVFCEECYVETERTKTAEKEKDYKRKTVVGIYQALAYTRPSLAIKLFYVLLPIACPALLMFGKKGYFWMNGILHGFVDYLRGDRTGMWQPTYME
jgi:cellulose synthase/poly-beta-1,6-N-acetylglucosamine synthase-like glycosyltransferase